MIWNERRRGSKASSLFISKEDYMEFDDYQIPDDVGVRCFGKSMDVESRNYGLLFYT
jgi:hypothetical protein